MVKLYTYITFFICIWANVYAQDCDDGYVALWDECYSIESTTSLDLGDNGLTGEIPPEIGYLVNLEK